MKQEPKNESGSLTCTIFRTVFDSRSSFFAPKPHGNACYAGYYFDPYCVSLFQGSSLVIVIMIDGSEKHNCEGGFLSLEFACL